MIRLSVMLCNLWNSIFVAWIFFQILRYRELRLAESNSVMLVAECSVATVLALANLILVGWIIRNLHRSNIM